MDLSRLPEPLRSKLQKQLAEMPADYRAKLESQLSKLPTEKLEQVLSKSSPLLERMAKKQQSSAGAPSNSGKSVSTHTIQGYEPPMHRTYDPHDHYNNTVHRGDRPLPSLMAIVMAAVVAAFVLYSFDAF